MVGEVSVVRDVYSPRGIDRYLYGMFNPLKESVIVNILRMYSSMVW